MLLLVVATALLSLAETAPFPGSLKDFHHERFERSTCVDADHSDSGVKTLYHYTTKAGRDGIMESGQIRPSHGPDGAGDDARFGDGVYLTELGPTNSAEKLVKNNWGRSAIVSDHLDNIKFAIVCRIPRDNVCRSLPAQEKNRDIWVYENSLSLTTYKCTDQPGIDTSQATTLLYSHSSLTILPGCVLVLLFLSD